MHPEDVRLGQLFRLLRLSKGLTQEEISLASSVPVHAIHKLETGRAGEITLARLRRLYADVDARARLVVWWQGAAADRLLDEVHASVAERGSVIIAGYGWVTPSEVTYSEFGERGAIDIFGHRQAFKAVAVCEVKSAFGSLEELNRSLDVKVRLAPTVCRKRFGWTPVHVGRIVIVPDVSTNRRIVEAHRQTLDELYPLRSREIRAWLRHPSASVGGIWFLSDPRSTRTSPDRRP
jgi:transcriptional regulator with XRE-family HTH domain